MAKPEFEKFGGLCKCRTSVKLCLVFVSTQYKAAVKHIVTGAEKNGSGPLHYYYFFLRSSTVLEKPNTLETHTLLW